MNNANLDPTVIAAIVGAIGILIGALLSVGAKAIGGFIRRRASRKRIRRRVLFDLLEIWHRVRVVAGLDTERLTERYLARVQKEYPNLAFGDAEKIQMVALMNELLASVFKDLVANDAQPASERYQCAIEALSQIDPVAAFRLSGNDDLKGTLVVLDRHIDRLQILGESKDEKEQSAFVLIERMKHSAKKQGIEAIRRDFERDVLGLARMISIGTYWKVWFLIRARRGDTAIDLANEFVVTEVLRPIMATHDAPYAKGERPHS